MAQFISINPEVWVNGETINSFVNSMPTGVENRKSILLSHGINVDPTGWFKQQNWLDAFKEVAESLGDMNLFLMGKAVIENAKFPPIKNLEESLNLLDVAYHMNHKLNGEVMFNPENGQKMEGIGNYNLISFNEKERKAVMQCTNPYSSKFDEGIITQLVRIYRPKDSYRQTVMLNTEKPSRRTGADSCEFLIHW